MKIAIIGYGKMGKTIESIAQERGHEITHKFDISNQAELAQISKDEVDVAIEFTQPESAFENIMQCIAQGIPIVSGTTGWLDKWHLVEKACQKHKGGFFYASNYSIGVNIFFKLNQYLANLMNQQTHYQVSMEEIHHTEKKDAPSGTAITLAEGILEAIRAKEKWVNEASQEEDTIGIVSKREAGVPGTHSIQYQSDIDNIEIKHTAFSRDGFATGAVLAAEWIQGKQGIFGMDDMLSF